MANNAQDTPQDNQPSLDEQINKALANVDEKTGKLQFSEDTDPLFKRAVIAEKKARDNQASFTKSRQELAAVTAAKDELEKLAIGTTSISAEQQEELEELKFSDPDKWFELKRQYEDEAKATVSNKIKETITAASEKAVQELTLVERKEALASFTSSTGIELTDDVMMNDIPPRLQSKMGSMPFEDYLQEVATYLGKGKVVKDTDSGIDQTNINKISGADIPSDSWSPELGDGIL